MFLFQIFSYFVLLAWKKCQRPMVRQNITSTVAERCRKRSCALAAVFTVLVLVEMHIYVLCTNIVFNKIILFISLDFLFKFLVIGSAGTGKSCILHQFIEGKCKCHCFIINRHDRSRVELCQKGTINDIDA